MSFFKRMTSGVVSRIDWMVSHVENHEALAERAIQQMQQAGARARVQLARVNKDGIQLRARIKEEQQNHQRWQQRAVQFANSDQDRALECLRRSKMAEKNFHNLNERYREHEHAQHKLSKDIQTIEERIKELKEKLNLMRTRQSRAEAVTAIGKVNPNGTHLDDVFERWEMSISETEIYSGLDHQQDQFEKEFMDQEEENDLLAELSLLVDSQKEEIV